MASIRERISKGGETTWAVLYRHGGKQRSHTFRDSGTAEMFASLVDRLGPERSLKALAEDDQDHGITVDQMARAFMDWKTGDVTPRTMADYRRDYDNWVKTWFGHRPAELVTETDVQKWVDHMRGQLSPKSVAGRHQLLHAIYDFGRAKVRRLVSHNPCLETSLPKRTRKPPKGTTNAEWRAILAAAADRNPEAHDLILFMGDLGWRWSEAAALAVADVEDDGRHVWVDVTRVFRIIDNRQVLLEGAAKSFAGFRRSRVPSESAAMFRRRIVGKGPKDYVFTNRRGRHWNQNTFLRDTWPALLTTAGVGDPTRKPTPHWLRHMAVGNMARAGIPMHEIQRIIGHEDIGTTNKTYGGMVSTLSVEAVERYDQVLANHASEDVVAGVVLARQ